MDFDAFLFHTQPCSREKSNRASPRIIVYNVKPRLVNVPCIVQSFGRAIQDSVNVTPPPV